MDMDDGPLGTPESLGLNFPPNTNINGIERSRRKSGTSAPQVSLLSSLSRQHVSGYEDGMAASEAEVAKTFFFAPIYPAARGPATDENQQQGSSMRTPQSVGPPRNGPAAFVPNRIPARRSQQFLPTTSKSSAPINEIELRKTAPAHNVRQETPSHVPDLEVQHGKFSRVAQFHASIAMPQPSKQLQGLQSRTASQAQQPTVADASARSLQVSLSNRIVSHAAPVKVSLEEHSQTGGQPTYSDPAIEDEQGEFGNDYVNHDHEGFLGDSDDLEEHVPDDPVEQELYPEQCAEDQKNLDPALSQGLPAEVSLAPAFSAGFIQQFEEYMKMHQQDAQDAKARWNDASLEEWKAGKYEMMEHVRKIVDMTKAHMKRKLAAYHALHDDLDGHKEGLQKRRKLLGELEKDATQTGKGLMSRLIGR